MPPKPVLIVEGRVCCAARCTSRTASPSETLGGRLNDSVTDGSWPLWFTLSGPTSGVAVATAVSGTSAPFWERMLSRLSAAGSRWYCGNSSRITQYWLLGV